MISLEAFTDAQQQLMHGAGPESEIEYRLAWARTYLKKIGALENSKRGCGALLSSAERRQPPTLPRPSRRTNTMENSPHSTTVCWHRYGRVVQRHEADRGSRMEARAAGRAACTRAGQLRAPSPPPSARGGFISAKVTGKPADGGIDGIGIYRLSLVTIPVIFQCKRYSGSVSASDVRDFRGAMTGRANNGLLITTGTFTAEAKREATRDGAPPVDLIDGDRLCDLFKEYELGVRRTVRQVEDLEIAPSFFADL